MVVLFFVKIGILRLVFVFYCLWGKIKFLFRFFLIGIKMEEKRKC